MNPAATTVRDSDVEHPPLQQLTAFVLGQLDDADSAVIEVHLRQCEICRQLLQTTADDSLVALVRKGKDTPISRASAPIPSLQPSRRPPRGYEVLAKLGEGGMGVVWQARQLGLGRLVALKRIRSTGPVSSEALLRFRREAEAAARVQHANIVQIHEIGEQDGEPYLVLEYVEGGSLAQKLAEGPLLPAQAAALIETLARAMHHAHEHGIIHRDLKPANILLTAEGTPKIGDFGLAKHLDEAAGHTQSGAILGTPSYMAPEQADGGRTTIGPAIDTYALGAILYETLTGQPPFRGPSVMDTLEQVRQREPVPPRVLQPKVPPDLQTICLKCLQKQPRRRYASALELAEDLRRFATGEPIRARPIGRLERSLKWMHRKPAWAALAGFVVLAIIGSIGGAIWHDHRLRAQVVRAENAETRARRQYRDARDLSKRILARLGDLKPTRVPGERELFAGVLDDALAFHRDTLQRSADADPEVRADMANALYQIGILQSHLGQTDNADHNFHEAARLYEQLSDEAVEPLDYLKELSQCYNALGCIQPNEAAVSWCQKALALRQQSVRLQPEDADAAALLAQSHLNLGARLHYLQRRNEAEEQYLLAAEVAKKVAAEHPDLIGCRFTLANSYVNLGLIHHQTDRRDPRFARCLRQADAFYRQAETLLQPLIRDYPHHTEFHSTFAAVAVNWGNLLCETEGFDSALKVFNRGIDVIETLLRKDATNPTARDHAFKLHATRAQIYEARHRFADAATEWARVLELAKAADRPLYHLRRCLSLVRGGDSLHAVAEADALAAEPGRTPDQRYNTACAYALCGCGDKALAELNKLQSDGYFKDREHLKTLRTDRDLDSLRKRDDFAQLVNRLAK